jgi:hypothetical protein
MCNTTHYEPTSPWLLLPSYRIASRHEEKRHPAFLVQISTSKSDIETDFLLSLPNYSKKTKTLKMRTETVLETLFFRRLTN